MTKEDKDRTKRRAREMEVKQLKDMILVWSVCSPKRCCKRVPWSKLQFGYVDWILIGRGGSAISLRAKAVSRGKHRWHGSVDMHFVFSRRGLHVGMSC